jgi:4-amino-4-deoxy-L-arabinose transferase-like glycosyltransferase
MASRQRKIILIIIVLLGFGLRFYAAKSIHITWDEEMVFKPMESINFDFDNLSLPVIDRVSSVEQATPMASIYIAKLVYSFFGDSLLALRLVVVFFNIFTILIVYFLVKQALGAKAALLSSFLLSISQVEIAASRSANHDPLLMFFVLSSLFLFYKAIRTHDKRLMILNGIVIGLGFWVKESMLFLIPIYFIFLFFCPEYRGWLKDKFFWFSFGLSFLIALPLGIVNMASHSPRYEYLSSIKSIGPSLAGIGFYLGELILLGIKWFGSTDFFHNVADTLTRETPPVNFLLGMVILVAVVKSIRKKIPFIRLLVICFLFNFLLFCFVRKSDVIDGIWSLGSLEWGMMGFIPGVILASNMLVGYIKKRKVRGRIFLFFLIAFISIRSWDMVSYPLCCYFPEREWCIKDELYNKAFRYNKEGKIKRAKETLRKVYRVTDNNRYKTDAALRLAKILLNEGKPGEANMYLYQILSDNPKNREALELLKGIK